MTAVFVLHRRQFPDDLRLLDACTGAASDRDWLPVRIGFDSVDRRSRHGVISAGRAEELYRQVHRDPSLVISPLAAEVERHGIGGRLALGRFLRYKAHFQVVVTSGPGRLSDVVESAIEEFGRWLAGAPSTHLDPRVLPLHLFDPHSDLQDLDSEAGRDRFRLQRRRQASFVDPVGRPWVVPPYADMHGLEVLSVRSHNLPRGFHWDVQGGRRTTTLRTLTRQVEVARNGHRNVYPDATLRPAL